MLCKLLAMTTWFFFTGMEHNGFRKNLLQTNAVLIAALNLSIIR